MVGASAGLGRAFVDGLRAKGHETIGVSRSVPDREESRWIAADFSNAAAAADVLAAQAPASLDVLIWNLGIWEPAAFTSEYRFDAENDEIIEQLLEVNTTALILTLKRLLPVLLRSESPKVMLTGSTSGLPRSGRPEVAFGASKAALNGIADALREGYRDQRLAVSTLQLGYLNTEHSLSEPRSLAASHGDGTLIPVHDVVEIVGAMLNLSNSSFVRELVMPAILDERY